MYGGDGSSDGAPKGSFEIYKAEGDVLFKHGEFKKALDSFNTALELRPGDKITLVARSQCYLEIGDAEKALIDANETLSDDPNYIKGLLQKAEAFYQKGRFEHALMFYHRGHKLRPEVQAFRLGIQKAQEAIHNSVGGSEVKLKNEGDLTLFYEDQQKGKPKKNVGYNKPLTRGKKDNHNNARLIVTRDKGTVKLLLGQLYKDQEYLENLLIESECHQNKSESKQAIRALSLDGLTFLDKRMDFWQQQQKNARNAARSKQAANSKRTEPTQWILNNLEEIDEAQASGHYEQSLKKAKAMLKTVQDRWDDESVPNRPAVVANLHSCIGNSYLELGKNDKALEHHEKDFEISKQQNLEEGRSRALDNLGRVYARMKQFTKAIQVWEEKLPTSDSTLEKTWLLHEIGRCYLEVGDYEKAKQYGIDSLESAVAVADDVWQLNASVLIAQSLVKLNEFDDALHYFEESLTMAKQQSDNAALLAIQNAIHDVNNQISTAKSNEANNNEATTKESDYDEYDFEQEAYRRPSHDPFQGRSISQASNDSIFAENRDSLSPSSSFEADSRVSSVEEEFKGQLSEDVTMPDVRTRYSFADQPRDMSSIEEESDSLHSSKGGVVTSFETPTSNTANETIETAVQRSTSSQSGSNVKEENVSEHSYEESELSMRSDKCEQRENEARRCYQESPLSNVLLDSGQRSTSSDRRVSSPRCLSSRPVSRQLPSLGHSVASSSQRLTSATSRGQGRTLLPPLSGQSHKAGDDNKVEEKEESKTEVKNDSPVDIKEEDDE